MVLAQKMLRTMIYGSGMRITVPVWLLRKLAACVQWTLAPRLSSRWFRDKPILPYFLDFYFYLLHETLKVWRLKKNPSHNGNSINNWPVSVFLFSTQRNKWDQEICYQFLWLMVSPRIDRRSIAPKYKKRIPPTLCTKIVAVRIPFEMPTAAIMAALTMPGMFSRMGSCLTRSIAY